MSSDTYRSSLVSFRGRDLLRQAIGQYDGNPEAHYWVTISAAGLLFATGTTLGAILQLRYPDGDILISCAIVAAIAMLLLCIGAGFFVDSITRRRAKLISTLESYLDAEADCAKFGSREAH